MPLPRHPEPEPMDLPDEARAYAEADFAEVNAAFVDRLLDLAGDRAELRVIDLGTGPGDIPVRLAKARPGWHVTAVDISPAMLDLARTAVAMAGVHGQVELVLADAKNPSALPVGPFDVVCSNSILHHVSDPGAFWRRVADLAAPGALIFHRDLFRPASRDTVEVIVDTHARGESDLLREEFRRSLLAAWTPQEIRDQLRTAGLAGLTVETVSDRHVDIVGRIDECTT